MNQWAKLHAKLAESEDFMALHCADPNAALLFLMALPQAAPWGILPATPALFRARVCPMLDLSLEQVQTCLRLIVDQGCFTAYEDRQGKPLVYITNWSENQSRQWDRVAAPQYDLPPNWTPPAGLAKGLADAAKGGRNLRLSAIEERLQDDTSRENLRQVLDSTPENVPEFKTSLRLVLDQSQTSLTQRVERSRTENDSNTLVRIGENDLAARTISPDPVEEKQQQQAAKAKRDADRLRQQTEKLDAALAALSQPDRELLDTMLTGQQIAKGKPLTLLQQATQADIYARELAEHGPECWRDCCRLSCEKQIYTAEYARGCTKHWTPSGGNGNGRGRLPPQWQLTELDRMQLQADYEREEAARRGDQRTTDGTRDPRPTL